MTSVLPSVTCRIRATACFRFARVHSCRRFIEHHHIGAPADRHSDLQRPLLGVGQHRRLNIAARGQADVFHQPVGPFADIAKPVQRRPERVFVSKRPERGAAQILVDRHPGKDVGDLKTARQAAAVDLEWRQTVDALAVETHFAGGRRQAPADQMKQRRLASAVGSDDRVPLAGGDLKRNAADDFRKPETLIEVD